MKRKRSIVLMLTVVMMCNLLAGCGSSGENQEAAGDATTNQAAVETDSETGTETGTGEERELLEDGNTYAEGLPIVRDKITLRIARGRNALDSSTDTNEKPIMQLMEEATNIHIEWIDVPQGDGFDEQMSILLSTDMPDAFMGGVDSTDIMKDYDSFLPLNDLLENYAPNIMETYNKTDGEAIELLTYPNGNIYSFM